MKTVNVHEAKTHFSSLLMAIEKEGKSVLICRHGHPVADLIPHRRKSRLVAHPVLSKIKVHYDPTAPLTPDEWPEEG